MRNYPGQKYVAGFNKFLLRANLASPQNFRSACVISRYAKEFEQLVRTRTGVDGGHTPSKKLSEWYQLEFRCGHYVFAIPLSAQVIFAIRGDLLLWHHLAPRRREIFHGFARPQALQVLIKFDAHLRQIILIDRPALGTEIESVVFDLEESDGVGTLRQRLVEDQDGRLDAGIRIEHARRQRHHSDEVILHQQLAQLFVGALTLENDT